MISLSFSLSLSFTSESFTLISFLLLSLYHLICSYSSLPPFHAFPLFCICFHVHFFSFQLNPLFFSDSFIPSNTLLLLLLNDPTMFLHSFYLFSHFSTSFYPYFKLDPLLPLMPLRLNLYQPHHRATF